MLSEIVYAVPCFLVIVYHEFTMVQIKISKTRVKVGDVYTKLLLLILEHQFAIIKQKGGNVSLGKVIFHIDVNSAFLSWEAVYRLYHLGGSVDLREQVSAVGGDMAMRHGIILAKSIPAKRYKIQTGETILEAQRKCPNLLLVPPNYGLYERCSAAFMNILRQYSPVVEQYSIDEAFVDMTGTEGLWGEPGNSSQPDTESDPGRTGFYSKCRRF